MTYIIHVQTVLLEETLNALKNKTNREFTKDALNDAVEHILHCKENVMREALKAARDNLQKGCSKEIMKQIDSALEG